MFTKLATLIAGFMASRGVRAASVVLPYLAPLVPAVVLVASGMVLYLQSRGDTARLVFMALFAVSEGIVGYQIDAAAKK